MEIRAAPSAPESAAALPPPGAGEFEPKLANDLFYLQSNKHYRLSSLFADDGVRASAIIVERRNAVHDAVPVAGNACVARRPGFTHDRGPPPRQMSPDQKMI
jgi:hypothetical protein